MRNQLIKRIACCLAFIFISTSNGGASPLRVESDGQIIGRTDIVFQDSQNFDAFGRFRVSNPTTLFSSKFIHDRGILAWGESIKGSIINYTGLVGTFQVGEVITGGTSGFTGTVSIVTGTTSLTYDTSRNDFVDGETITGGTSLATATITNSNTGSDSSFEYDTSSDILRVGVGANDKAIKQTHRYYPYIPNKSTHVASSFVMGAGKSNVDQYVGIGDGLNGLFFKLQGTTFGVVLRSSVSGSTVDTFIPQSSFNVDKLDGTGSSGVTLDITKIQLAEIDFQWQSAGRVRFSLNIGGKTIEVHEILNANILDVPYMKTPSLPIRYELRNTGVPASATEMKVICSGISAEGGDTITGFEFTTGAGLNGKSLTRVTATNGVRRPIYALRLKNAYPSGQPNRRTIKFISALFSAVTKNAMFEVVHIHEVGAVTATWDDVEDESGAEYSVDITAITPIGDDVHVIASAFVAAGEKKFAGVMESGALEEGQHGYISQNIDSTGSQYFVIYATGDGGNSSVTVHFKHLEFD